MDGPVLDAGNADLGNTIQDLVHEGISPGVRFEQLCLALDLFPGQNQDGAHGKGQQGQGQPGEGGRVAEHAKQVDQAAQGAEPARDDCRRKEPEQGVDIDGALGQVGAVILAEKAFRQVENPVDDRMEKRVFRRGQGALGRQVFYNMKADAADHGTDQHPADLQKRGSVAKGYERVI